MSSPQSGIFALGAASHVYVELDRLGGVSAATLVGAVATSRELQTTMDAVNLVAGFRPEVWREAMPGDAPTDVAGFDEDLVGRGGFAMPATQHDAVLWLSGGAHDTVFDVMRRTIVSLAGVATVSDDTWGWPYQHDRDLTGFIDGTENPSLLDAFEVATIPEGSPGAGGSVLLLQKWRHDADGWESLSVAEQEAAMGRTKTDSVELDPRPDDSHVVRTDQEVFGKIFRRNMPYGSVSDHGTMFVGFSADQHRLVAMLQSMAGVTDGVRDAITRYAQPLSGAYYVVPSTESLRRCVQREEG